MLEGCEARISPPPLFLIFHFPSNSSTLPSLLLSRHRSTESCKLSALPETLDPASYAQLLPCCGPPYVNTPQNLPGNPPSSFSIEVNTPLNRPVFYYMEAGGGISGITAEAFDKPGTTGESSHVAEEAVVAAASANQRDPRILAEWFSKRAREIDARAGQLRHASTMCELGAARVSSELMGDFGDGVGGEEVGRAEASVVELLRLRSVLQHVCLLVRERRGEKGGIVSSWQQQTSLLSVFCVSHYPPGFYFWFVIFFVGFYSQLARLIQDGMG